MGNNPQPLPVLDIIGAGHVGKTLGRLWHQNRVFRIGKILNRSRDSAEKAAHFIGAGTAATDYDTLSAASFVMIAVNDDAIENCSRQLADNGGISPGSVVFHASGALSSEILRAAKEKGAVTASLHPLNSFTDPAHDARGFAGTYCALEGDGEAVAALSTAVSAIGGKSLSIRPEKKIYYHAAAVFACNYLTTLFDIGLRCAGEAGIGRDDAKAMLRPLVENTLRNNFDADPVEALTGPVARGDKALVERQVRALGEWKPGIAALYAGLGIFTADLAAAGGKAGCDRLEEIRTTLKNIRAGEHSRS